MSLKSRLTLNERGSSLVAVIGIMAVFAIITLTIVGSTLSTLSVTGSARDGVQAQAAAEAGIDATAVALAQNICASSPQVSVPDTVPRYAATLSYQVEDEPFGPECDPAATRIRTVSTGFAESVATSIGDDTNSRTVEAIYLVTPGESRGASGISIFADRDFSVIESVTMFAKDTTVYVRDGDARCVSSGAKNVDIVVQAGDVTLGESCGIFGDVWASGAAVIGGSAIIHESLVADKLVTTSTAQVSGDAWISGDANIGSGTKIGGSLVAGSMSGPIGVIIGGVTHAATDSMPAPLSGIMDAGWYKLDYKYSNAKDKIRKQNPKDQVNWDSFDNVYRIDGVCGLPELQAAADSFGTQSGIIECQGAGKGKEAVDVAGSGTLTLHGDVAIIAESFKFRQSAQIDAAMNHKLWLVTPDGASDKTAKCNANAGDFSVIESFKVNPTVDVMVYSPCNVSISTSSQWRGQIWGGTVKMGTSGVYTYAEVGFPGAAASGGAGSGSGSSPSTLGRRESIRDLD